MSDLAADLYGDSAAAPVAAPAVAPAAAPVSDLASDLYGAPSTAHKAWDVMQNGMDSSIQGAGKLESNIIAPFLSDEHLNQLKKAGLYSDDSVDPALAAEMKAKGGPKGADDYARIFASGVQNSPVGQYSQTAYSGIAAPLAPVFNAAQQKLKDLGVSKGTLDMLNAGLSTLGVAGPSNPAAKINTVGALMDKLPDVARDDSSSILKNNAGSPKAANPTQDFADQEARNTSYVQGLNQTIDNIKGPEGYGGIYDKGREISGGVNVSAPSVKGTVDDLLEDLKGDPAHKTEQGSSQAFRDLEAVKNSFDENGDIPLDSVTLLKQRVNDLYDPKMGMTRGKIYNTLNNQLKDVIGTAKKDNPEWGQIMDQGNGLFQLYKKHIDENSLLSDKYSLDDKKDYDSLANSLSPYDTLKDQTRARTNDISNVKNLEQYEGIMRLLPKDLQESFTKDVLSSKTTPPGMASKLKLAYNAYKMNPAGTAKSLYDIVVNPKGTPSINLPLAKRLPHMEDAASYHSNIAHNAYQDFLDKPPAPENNVSWLPEQQKLTGPKPMLALPAPESEMIAPENTPPRVMTPQERADAATLRQHPDSIAAQRARADLKLPYKGWRGEDIDTQFEEAAKREGFKRGGAVQPTELQKAAGNYKKEHTRIHGLDISIENPKGSERSGVDKGGKKWSVKMPHAYGYIKRTHGADGDHLDCFLGPDESSPYVFVVDQKDHSTGKFDEHKIVFGCRNRQEAEKAYRSSYSDNKNRIMKTTRFSVPEFKQWIKEGNTKQPVKKVA